MQNNSSYDAIIIGGSYAGLSAAMALGRSRRRVLVLDSGQPCNRQTPHSHNFLTRDGDTPAGLAAISRQQVEAYPTVQIIAEKAIYGQGSNGSFAIETESGSRYQSLKVLLATGMADIPLPINGFAECWGISVLHCPYCHGYEVRDEPLGIIANGPVAFEFSRLIYNWSKQLTLFTNGASTIPAEQVETLQRHGVAIVENEIAAFTHEAGYLQEILFTDGNRQAIAAVFARGGLQQHSHLATQLSCTLHTEGMLTGLIATDNFGKTNVPGVYAAGDNCSPMRSVANAVAAGNRAGAFINHELVGEDFE